MSLKHVGPNGTMSTANRILDKSIQQKFVPSRLYINLDQTIDNSYVLLRTCICT